MPLYLAPYSGAGTQADPFVPRGSEQPEWTAVDLRPDPMVGTGDAALYLPTPVVDATLVEIGMDKDEFVGPAVRTIVSNRLGKTLDAGWTLGEALGQVLMFPANGLKPLRPYHGLYEVWLNNVRWFLQPQLAGGASYSDNFNRADAPDLGANWAAVPTFLEPPIVSNAVQPAGVLTSWSVPQYSAATFKDDQWASVELVTLTASNNFAGPAVRGSDATQTVYYSRTNGPFGATAGGSMTKWVAGTASTLWSFTDRTINAGTVVKLEARGSTLTRYENGVLIMALTDTSITSGRPGLFLASDVGVAADSRLDNWLGGDLDALPITRFDRSRFPKMKLQVPMPTGRR